MAAPIEEQAKLVECTHCGTLGYVKFDDNGLTEVYMVCKCPRMSVEEANKQAREKVNR